MDNIIQFITGPFLAWGMEIFTALIIFSVLAFYYLRHKFNLKFIYWIGVGLVFLFKIFYAGIATWAQYMVWKTDQFSRLLLPPNQDISYFTFYSWTHFWLELVISFGISILFYFFLKFLNTYENRFFIKGEVELGFLMALVSGWPGFLIFIPMTFVFVVLVSIFRRLFMNKMYTTLGIPFILGSAAAFYLEIYLVETFNLTVFY